MATGRITLDTGSTLHTTTYTVSEDAVTKHVPRSVLNNSSGSEVGINGSPFITSPSGGTITSITNTVTITGSTSVVDTVVVTGSTAVVNTVTITGSVLAIGTTIAGTSSTQAIAIQGLTSMIPVTVTGSTTVINTVTITGSTAVVNTVTVTGSTTIVSMPAITGSTSVVANVIPAGVATVGDGRKVVTTSGSAVQLDTASCKYMYIVGETDNTGIISVGTSTTVAAEGTQRGIILYAGQSTGRLDVSNTNLFYINATVSGEGVTYAYFN